MTDYDRIRATTRNRQCRTGLFWLWVFLSVCHGEAAYAQYKTLGPGSCGLGQSNCHAEENDWWKDDAHKVTVDAFFDDPAAYEKIARLAGVDPASMLKGTNQCMSCHGTIISGKEGRDTEDGVSCESCHGPGSGYKDPHSEGDVKLGVNRSGYIKALQLGLVELKNLDKRANTCVRCHYITDQKLLAAGHPDGARFNYISGLKKVAKHWKRQPDANDLTKAPFEKAMNAKGPVAQIAKIEAAAPPPTPAEKPVTPPPSAAAPATATPASASNAPLPETKTVASANTPPTTNMTSPANAAPATRPAAPPRPVVTQPAVPVTSNTTMTAPVAMPPMMASPESTRVFAPVFLPPFPSVSDTASIGEILLIVKKRLELLYQKTGQ